MNITPFASPMQPNNGENVELTCGQKNLTIFVEIPETNPPSNINYSWTYPNGWSGPSSTSSNVVSATADAGADDGAITVDAKRSDGAFKQRIQVFVHRPRVEDAIITDINWFPSDKPLCSGEQRQLSGADSENATIFNWTKTGGVSILSGSNQSNVTITGSSFGTLTLTANNACNVAKSRTVDIISGPPVIGSRVRVDGHSNYYPNYINGNADIEIIDPGSCETYYWELFGGSGYFGTNGYCGSCGNTFNGITYDDCGSGYASTSTSMAIRIRSANRCGPGTDAIVPLQNNSGGSGYYMISGPNPTHDQISITFEPKAAENLLKAVKLVSHNRSSVIRNIKAEEARMKHLINKDSNMYLKVDHLPRGLYYLILEFEDQTFEEGIILN